MRETPNIAEPFRVIITGDRHWWCEDFATEAVASMREKYGPGLVIVHGAADGVDKSFAKACNGLGVKQEPHPADWDRFGKAAGPRRNEDMVRHGARFALALHPDLTRSKGTRDCVRRCLEAGIPVWHVARANSVPTRLREI